MSVTKHPPEVPVHSGLKLVVAVSLLTTAVASAQTFEQLTEVRIDTPPSSVRSAAMGGTTTTTSNDVSLLADNPIAASSLQHLTFSIVATNALYPTQGFGSSGNLFYSYRDDLNATGFSNVSIAAPFGNTVIGAYYRDEPRLRSREPVFLNTLPTSPYEPRVCNDCVYLFGPSRDFDRRDTRYGVTLSWKAGNVAFGAGAEMQQLDERASIARTGYPVIGTPGSATFERLFRTTSGHSIVPNAAIAWTINPSVVVAASYNGAGSFDRVTRTCATDAAGSPICSTQTAELNRFKQRSAASYRGGVSINVARPLTVAAEIVRRQYGTYAVEPYSIISERTTLPYRDVTETHVGAEYRLASLALRAGWWHDPQRFDDDQFAPFWAQSSNHLTLGLGLKASNAEISFAVDDPRNDNGRRASVGLTYSF